MNESPGSSHDRRRNSNLRWIICGLLFLAATVNYADRQVIGILKPTLQLQLHWSEVDYGHIIAAFQFAYALGYLLVGRLVDRTGSYRGFSFAVVFWSLAEMAHAFARSVTGFGIARSALALGEGGSFPASMKTVAEWFPENERALATGIFNAGTNIGAVVAPLTVPWITMQYGWQWAFLATGAIGFVWVVLWLVVYGWAEKRVHRYEFGGIPVSCPESVRPELVWSPPTRGASWAQLLTRRQVWAIAIGEFLTDPVWFLYLFWIPDL
jgi:MFS transporter, ACS family, hexuronate transporter